MHHHKSFFKNFALLFTWKHNLKAIFTHSGYLFAINKLWYCLYFVCNRLSQALNQRCLKLNHHHPHQGSPSLLHHLVWWHRNWWLCRLLTFLFAQFACLITGRYSGLMFSAVDWEQRGLVLRGLLFTFKYK